ncbi:hypothetical protein KM043_005527 [Ampulex compressa]|nr:hypothetical protein KM043_005527 [Ampulex compressa]
MTRVTLVHRPEYFHRISTTGSNHKVESTVFERIQSQISKLCETLEKRYKPNPENLAIHRSNHKQLLKAYYKASEPFLKNMKNAVNKYISIPSNVLLEEDLNQRIQYTEAEFESIQKKLESLQQRARRAAILSAALKEELDIMESFTVCEDTANTICSKIEELTFPETNDDMLQLVEYYKELKANIAAHIPVSDKIIYNTIDNLKLKDYDLCTL